MRSGTLPVPLIVGLGRAASIAQSEMAGEATAASGPARAIAGRPQIAFPAIWC